MRQFVIPVFLILTLVAACSLQIGNVRRIYDPSQISRDQEVKDHSRLKIHIRNGHVSYLDRWEVNETLETISGVGFVHGVNRKRIGRGSRNLAYRFEDIVLVETNEYSGFNLISPVLMTFSTLYTALSIPCLADPKACFGSCPTFYLHKDDSLIIQAEGFSSSITKSLEAVDVDQLVDYSPEMGGQVKIELMNEALETHYIRKIELLALPKIGNGTVLHGKDKFYEVTGFSRPLTINNDNHLSEKLAFRDNNEYLAESDSLDLTTKETLILEFDEFQGSNPGIMITQRQSLMTTFLFYQSMGHMGSRAGDIIAAYERASPWARNIQKSMYDVLGGVEVSILMDGRWKPVGVLREQGPIVHDTHLLPIEQKGKFNKVKLRMTRGLWRIDQVALCSITNEYDPVVVKPHRLLNNREDDPVLLAQLNDPENYLVTFPGTTYSLLFQLPDQGEWTPFLRSRGYYSEWMRGPWLEEENTEMVRLLISDPEAWLKLMAPMYKKVESRMDSLFWQSKFSAYDLQN